MPIVTCESFTPRYRGHVGAPRPFCGKCLAHTPLDRRSNDSRGPATDIHQHPLLHLCHLPIMDHNGSVVHASEMHISLIKEKVINSCYKFCCPGPDDSSRSVCMCVCSCASVYMCVCMCVMSFITQVQLACPRVPGTVQCPGTKRADGTAFC